MICSEKRKIVSMGAIEADAPLAGTVKLKLSGTNTKGRVLTITYHLDFIDVRNLIALLREKALTQGERWAATARA